MVDENKLYRANDGFYWRFLLDGSKIACIRYDQEYRESGSVRIDMQHRTLDDFVGQFFATMFDVENA